MVEKTCRMTLGHKLRVNGLKCIQRRMIFISLWYTQILWINPNGNRRSLSEKVNNMAESTRKKQDIYLLGQPLKTAILCNKENAVRDSETAVIREVLLIWQRARIPTTQEYNAIKKLDDMFKLWQGLKKHSKRNSDAQRRQEQAFVHSRKDLFDIAHANVIELIQIQKDREFLLAQREAGRRGYMSGVDKNLALKEARSYERKRRQENYK
ncbi:hypothetical protein HELRODRAFT_184720 [Helobdella robusta]|uniref:Uncharacterized protein n=1 Tax=Helobdella robusta TaxID=6412 RepID=T1FLV0_HELRO|nr:hypothetical protein HELRODRAFT_184720 [Helobdella robusta]ESO03507.1 hypothetical protein HELRODRAFT_184720 [Helobdella robusta]